MDASIFKKSESELAETNSVQSKDSSSENGELVQKADLVLLKIKDDNDFNNNKINIEINDNDNNNNIINNNNKNNNNNYDNSNLSFKSEVNNFEKIEITDIENQNNSHEKSILETFRYPFQTKKIKTDEKKSSKLISAIIDKNLLKAAEDENIFVDDYGEKKNQKVS